MSDRVVRVRYKPLPAQKRFHDCTAYCKLFQGGVGSGKTTAGSKEALILSAANPTCDGLIVAPTWGILNRTTLRAFRDTLPREIIADEKKSERYIELINGARIYYGSAELPHTLEGANAAWAWGDEARYWPKRAWEIVLARVRCPKARRLCIALTSTPARSSWLYDVFVTLKDPNFEAVVSPTSANIHLPEMYLRSLRQQYSAVVYAEYVEGKWVSSEGSVFPEFDEQVHLVELPPYAQFQRRPYYQMAANFTPVILGLDFGIRRSAVIAVSLWDRCDAHQTQNCYHVEDELLLTDTPTTRMPELIRSWCQRNKFEVEYVVCDPAGNARSIQTGVPDTEILQAAGFDVRWSTEYGQRLISYGIDIMRAALQPAEGAPRMYLASHLQDAQNGIVSALRSAIWDRAKDVYVKDGVADHVLDALRYLVVFTRGAYSH